MFAKVKVFWRIRNILTWNFNKVKSKSEDVTALFASTLSISKHIWNLWTWKNSRYSEIKVFSKPFRQVSGKQAYKDQNHSIFLKKKMQDFDWDLKRYRYPILQNLLKTKYFSNFQLVKICQKSTSFCEF